jgi:hypothetical protein
MGEQKAKILRDISQTTNIFFRMCHVPSPMFFPHMRLHCIALHCTALHCGYRRSLGGKLFQMKIVLSALLWVRKRKLIERVFVLLQFIVFLSGAPYFWKAPFIKDSAKPWRPVHYAAIEGLGRFVFSPVPA